MKNRIYHLFNTVEMTIYRKNVTHSLFLFKMYILGTRKNRIMWGSMLSKLHRLVSMMQCRKALA